MKIRHIWGLILLFFFVFFSSNNVYARRQGSSVYQAFLNSLAQEQPESYANYISNGACYIFDVSLDSDEWYLGSGSFTGTSLPKSASANRANKIKNSSSYPYSTYICYWSKKGSAPIVRNGAVISSCNKTITFFDKGYVPADQRDYYFMSILTGEGNIVHIHKPPKSYSDYYIDFYLGGTTDVIWADEDIHWAEGNIYKSSTKSTSIPNIQFDFNGHWDSYELYEYLLSYISNNYNLYATRWAEGANPSCMIFDNMRGNIKANRLNNDFLPDTANNANGVDYLVVFYPDRFCCYHDSVNHDYYFNFFSLNLPFFYITITKATQSIQFYYMDLAYNNNTPVAQIHYEYPESLIFTNKNIIAKSNANDFILDGTSFTWWRTTSYERKPNPSITPVNPDSPGYAGVDTTTIESNQVSILDSIVGFFAGFFDTIKNAITSVFDFVADTILALWNTVKNQILSKLPVFWITDILSWIQGIYHNAITRSQDLDFIYNFTFFGKNIEFDPLILYKNNKIYFDKFISLGLIFGLIFFNINQIFVILKGGKQG